MPSWLVDLALLAILVGAVVFMLRDNVDDSAWEERWRGLSPEDRTRIAAAARRGALLSDPEEIELAAAYARRRRRERAPHTLRVAIAGLLGAALLIAGLVHDSTVLLIFGAIFLLSAAISLGRESQVAHNLRETASRDRRP